MSKVDLKVDSKKMLKDLASEKKIVRLNDRKEVEIIKEHPNYKVGQKITPHSSVADYFISIKLAKEVK